MDLSRRAFLRAAAAAGGALAVGPAAAWPSAAPAVGTLARRFVDLSRHFVFEYYLWYGVNPYRHWDQWDRQPPVDLASNYMPELGAYDSASSAVLEQHAAWIKSTGAGAINVSWWGRDTDVDRRVPLLMDVMAAHDIHVAFHLEPYANDRALNYARDIQYLITEYGDRRSWDCFLLLKNADGTSGPVFKSFRTFVPPQSTDCHGVTTAVPDYVLDSVWRSQTDRVREIFAADFDHVTLLSDALDSARARAGGFDGIAVYDNFVTPDTWRRHATDFSSRNLVFSFNTNPGFDGIAQRRVDPASCYKPTPFDPGGGTYDWTQSRERLMAEGASLSRIAESFNTTVALQTDPGLANEPRGFFLTYFTSFNEWHEGHQFEPMKNRGSLTDAERALGYHNADDGSYRLTTLRTLIRSVL